MAKLERVYNIPLRKEFQKVPKYKRAKKAVKAVKEFLMKHMKAGEVKVGKYLNEKIWERGIKNPPHHVKVNAVKEDDIVIAEIVGAPLPKEEVKEGKKEVKTEEKKEEAKEDKKVVKKEEEKPKEEAKEGKKKVKPVKKAAPKKTAKKKTVPKK